MKVGHAPAAGTGPTEPEETPRGATAPASRPTASPAPAMAAAPSAHPGAARSRRPHEVFGAQPGTGTEEGVAVDPRPEGETPRNRVPERTAGECGATAPRRTHELDASALFEDEVFRSLLGELIEERFSSADVEASFASLGAGGGMERRGPEPEDGFAAVPGRGSED